MIRVKQILYPTDFSSYSNQAYFHAVALAKTYRASLTILYVHAPAGSEPEQSIDYWRQQLVQIRPIDQDIPVHHAAIEGEPATEIVRYAEDAGFDLIVMGTHGRTGLERLLMGSVAEKVFRGAPCSVLTVKLPKGVTLSEKREIVLESNPSG